MFTSIEAKSLEDSTLSLIEKIKLLKYITKKTAYINALKCDPTFTEAYHELAKILDEKEVVTLDGTPLTKKELFKKAIYYTPDRAEFYHELALTLDAKETIKIQNLGTLTKERAHCISKLLTKETPEEWIELGILLSKDEYLTIKDTCLTKEMAFTKSLELDPDNRDAYHYLFLTLPAFQHIDVEGVGVLTRERSGFIHDIHLNKEPAKNFFKLGLSLDKDDVICVKHESLTKKELFLKAIKHDSKCAGAYHELGKLLTYKETLTINGTPLTKKEFFKKAIAYNHNLANAYSDLAKISHPKETIEIPSVGALTKESLACIGSLLTKECPEKWIALGNLLNGINTVVVGDKKITKRTAFSKALELDPNNPKAYRHLADNLEEKESVHIGTVGHLTQENARYIADLLKTPPISKNKAAKTWFNLARTMSEGVQIKVKKEPLTKKDMLAKSISCNPSFILPYQELESTLDYKTGIDIPNVGRLTQYRAACIGRILSKEETAADWFSIGQNLGKNELLCLSNLRINRISAFIQTLNKDPNHRDVYTALADELHVSWAITLKKTCHITKKRAGYIRDLLTKETGETFYALGLDLLEKDPTEKVMFKGTYFTPKDLFQKAIACTPNLADAYLKLAETLDEKEAANDINIPGVGYLQKESLACIGRLLEQENSTDYFKLGNLLNPDKKNTIQVKGEDLIKKNLFLKAIKFNPNYAEAYFELGKLLGNGESLNERHPHTTKKDLFQKAIACNPNYAEAYFELSKTLENDSKDIEISNVGTLTKNRALYISHLLEEDPSDDWGLSKIPEVDDWVRLGQELRPEEHIIIKEIPMTNRDLYSKALALDPNNILAYQAWTTNLAENEAVEIDGVGWLTNNRAHYLASLLANPTPQTYLELGNDLEGTETIIVNKEPLSAYNTCIKALNLNPNHAPAYTKLAEHLDEDDKVSIDTIGLLTKEKAACIVELLQKLQHPAIPKEETAMSWVKLGESLAEDEQITLHGKTLTKKGMYLNAIACNPDYAGSYKKLAETLKATDTINIKGVGEGLTKDIVNAIANYLETDSPYNSCMLGDALYQKNSNNNITIKLKDEFRKPLDLFVAALTTIDYYYVAPYLIGCLSEDKPSNIPGIGPLTKARARYIHELLSSNSPEKNEVSYYNLGVSLDSTESITINAETLTKKDLFKRRYPRIAPLLPNTIKALLIDLKEVFSGNHTYICKDGKIGYLNHVQNTVSYHTYDRYSTLFAYIKEHEAGNITEARLNTELGFHLRTGSFSYAEIPKHYTHILGVTATLEELSSFEKEQVVNYGINRCLRVPSPFKKSPVACAAPQIHSTQDTYFTAISGAVKATIAQNRAVLLVFEDEEKLNTFKKYCTEQDTINVDHTLTARSSASDRDKLIELTATSGRITHCTKAYGRGSDFICIDRTLTQNNGLHVIQTFLSEYKAEEIQIMGRTGRQDEPGSYQNIVLKDDLETAFTKETVNKLLDQKENADPSLQTPQDRLNEIRSSYLKTKGTTLTKTIASSKTEHDATIRFIKACQRRDYKEAGQLLASWQH